MERKFNESHLINFWYSILNNTEDYAGVLRRLESYLEEDGTKLSTLITQSEQNGNLMIKSMCYDALKRAGRTITSEQQEFLNSHRWQEDFWPKP